MNNQLNNLLIIYDDTISIEHFALDYEILISSVHEMVSKIKCYSKLEGLNHLQLNQSSLAVIMNNSKAKKSKTKSKCSLFTWTRRLIGMCLFIYAFIECFNQIRELTEDYVRHEVIESVSDHIEDFVEPPNFSFCFDILSTINSTLLLERHPYLNSKIDEIRKQDPMFHNWSANAIIHDYTQGPRLVFDLTLDEIFNLLPRFNKSIIACQFLNNNLKLDNCDYTYFTEYYFNQMVCNEFIWHPVNERPTESIRFPYDGIKIPGFQNTRFLALYLDLSHLLNVTVMSVMAHSSAEVSWDPEATTLEMYPEYGEAKIYGLSYHKTSRRSLPAPFQSNCTDFSKTPYFSRQDCLQNCSVAKFIKKTSRIPRYAIIRSFDENKILYDYKEREKYQRLIQGLSENCNKICGTSDCYSEEFSLAVLYSPRQSIQTGKKLLIHIYPPTKPDTAVNTSPSLTFQYYFASIGGTLGIWFGFSFYSCLIFLFDTTPKIIAVFKRCCSRKEKQRQQLTSLGNQPVDSTIGQQSTSAKTKY